MSPNARSKSAREGATGRAWQPGEHIGGRLARSRSPQAQAFKLAGVRASSMGRCPVVPGGLKAVWFWSIRLRRLTTHKDDQARELSCRHTATTQHRPIMSCWHEPASPREQHTSLDPWLDVQTCRLGVAVSQSTPVENLSDTGGGVRVRDFALLCARVRRAYFGVDRKATTSSRTIQKCNDQQVKLLEHLVKKKSSWSIDP